MLGNLSPPGKFEQVEVADIGQVLHAPDIDPRQVCLFECNAKGDVQVESSKRILCEK